jgi:hypothetical protein
MKIVKHIFHLLPVVFLGVCAILYPFWIKDGYLDELYPLIGSFIAIYGGFVASLVWYLKYIKNN